MLLKYLRGGLAGAGALVLASVVSNLLFFQLAREILFDSELQSDKLIAVLFEIEPLPLMFSHGVLYLAIAAGIGVVHGLVFAFIEPSLPTTVVGRGMAFAVILWALMALYFEFHAPFNMFGEPPVLVAVELLLWMPVVLVEGVILSFIYGKSRTVSFS